MSYSTQPSTTYTDPSTANTSSTSSTTETVYTPATTTPALPPRPVAATTSADIHTTNQGPAVHSTTSFTTNTGEAAHPIDLSNQPLVKPSHGLVHAFKKMTMGGQNKDLEMDPTLQHADQTLQTNMGAERDLHSQIQRYQQAQQALQEATLAVARSFHTCLSDETNPYAPISGELVRQVQLHSLVPSHANQLLDLTDSAVQDGDGAYSSIRDSLSTRKTKASDVEYYTAKVQKLTAEHEQALSSGNVKPAEKERLERNIGKMREIELEYNQENERLIADMNALWRRRIIRLGPALSTFIQTNQLVHQEQAVVFSQLAQATAAINPDVAHNTYLTSTATILVPVGSGHVDNRELINAAHQSGVRGEVVAQQKHLEQERNERQGLVSQGGGSLETVAQETIIRSEEQMMVMKERFVTERVRVRKVVATEMVTITVPVRKESIQIERESVDGPGVPVTAAMSLEEERMRAQKRQGRQQNTGNTGTSTHTAPGVVEDEEEESYELILSEERPRVVNEVVPIERVRVRKIRQVSAQRLEMDLKREHIDYASPHAVAGQQQTVTLTSGLQTVAGQNAEGFTDSTNSAEVVNRPATSAAATKREYVKADVDDVDAMNRIGYDAQGTGYGKEGVVGVNHRYYNGAAPGVTNTFDAMTAQSELTATNETVQPAANRPVV